MRSLKAAVVTVAAGLALGLVAPGSAVAAYEYTGPACNGRYQQVATITWMYTYTNWKATYYPNNTIRFSYDKYMRSRVDFPSSGIGFLAGRYSCTTSGMRPV